MLAVTADNASNNDITFFQPCQESITTNFGEYEAEESPFKMETARVRCLAHVLNLAVKGVLENLGLTTLKAVKVDDGEEDGVDFVINLDDVVQAEEVVAQEDLPDVDYDVSILGKVKKVIQQDNYEEMNEEEYYASSCAESGC
jgi:hypothetical protein